MPTYFVAPHKDGGFVAYRINDIDAPSAIAETKDEALRLAKAAYRAYRNSPDYRS